MSVSPTSREFLRALLICLYAALAPETLPALDPNHGINQYITTRWSSRDSFPGGAIYAIAQTPDGYLWIGSQNGLVRFDGMNFRLFEHANTPTLPPGHVLGLIVDSEGVLWVRMESPFLLRHRGGIFEQAYPPERPPPFSPNAETGATAIANGASRDVLVAPPIGPQRHKAGKFTPIVSSGAGAGLAMAIAETADSTVWIGMRDTGLIGIRSGHGSPVTGLPDQKVNVLLPGTGSELWIGTDGGLARWDGYAITKRGVPAALERSRIIALARDRDSNVWISTPAGITRLASGSVTIREASAGLPGVVNTIFEDREGSLWLGGTEGLMQLRNSSFLGCSTAAADGGSLYVDTFGRGWIGPSSGGLLWIRGAEQHSVSAPGFGREMIYSISGGPGELWFGRGGGGVTRLREENGGQQWRTYTSADGLASGLVYAVHRGRDGTVWAGMLSGAVSSIKNDRVTTYTTAQGLGGDAITTIDETSDGVIWAGTTGGLHAFRHGKWRRYGGDDGMPPGRVNSLAPDEDGVLWIGTSAGLYFWAGARIESARNVPDSLQGEIYGLAADNTGNLWISTDRRVVRISLASLRGQFRVPAVMREFSVADGLPSTRGIRRDDSVVKDSSGRIWFSLQGGVCVVNPSPPSALAPALVNVESVVVDGQPLGIGEAARYPSDRQRVVFNYAGVSLAVPGRVRYRYMLDGYDRDWSQPTESREAAYTNLPPASYTFHVMASNSEGLWNGSPASVPFTVDPLLWQAWWFRLTAAGLVGAAIFVGLRYRAARLHAAMNLRFEERLAERTRIARDLHDTLLQSFQGLMLQLQVVQDLLPPGQAKEQLAQNLDRGDQAIAEGRRAVYGLRYSSVAGNDLEEALRSTARELLGTQPIAFRIETEGPARNLHPILRDEIYRIACEALRNAFKHARAKHVEAEITYGDKLFQLRIRDDGVGIPQEFLDTGRSGHFGLRGMRERARQSGGNLEIWSRNGSGTEIALSIPGALAYGIQSKGTDWWRFFGNKVT